MLSYCFQGNSLQAGASGALFGLTGVLLVDLLQNWKLIENPMRNLICMIISTIFSFALGMLPGIDNFCHIGLTLTG